MSELRKSAEKARVVLSMCRRELNDAAEGQRVFEGKEFWTGGQMTLFKYVCDSLTGLEAALADKQEPVAWMDSRDIGKDEMPTVDWSATDCCNMPLYTHPAPMRELSESDVLDGLQSVGYSPHGDEELAWLHSVVNVCIKAARSET